MNIFLKNTNKCLVSVRMSTWVKIWMFCAKPKKTRMCCAKFRYFPAIPEAHHAFLSLLWNDHLKQDK